MWYKRSGAKKLSALEDIIGDYEKSQSAKDKAETQIDKLSVTYSNKLSKMLNQYIKFADLSLVDDLGYYKTQVMEQKKLFWWQKHTAVSQLRPSQEGVMRALMFKEGKGEPLDIPSSLNLGEWADATGEDTKHKAYTRKGKGSGKSIIHSPYFL